MAGIGTLLMRRAAALVTALLLALCVASPAIAEVGCSWDAAMHFTETADHAGGDEPDDGSGEPDRDSHCAFGHGHGSLASSSASPAAPPHILTFAPSTVAIFVSSTPSGLDRPPRA